MKVQLINLRKSFQETLKGKKALKVVNHNQFQSNQHYNAATKTILTHAVNKINVEIESGKLIGLLGPSGCGKSTTLFMIAGLHDVSEGKVMFGEENVTNVPVEKRGIGLVFQNYALYPHLTVGQNIAFPLENSKGDIEKKIAKEMLKDKSGNLLTVRDYIKNTVQEMANLVGVGHLLDRKPKALSGGQQQRVAIARALAKKPRILLLDEPLSNLDARLRLQTREEIKRIQKETGITTIFVTHDQDEAMSICDEIIVMNYGNVQQQGQPQAVYNNPNNLFVARFLGMPPINEAKGEIKAGKLLIGDYELTKIDAQDQEVTIGIRPEAFAPANGRLIDALFAGRRANLSGLVSHVEPVGRDINVFLDVNGAKMRALMLNEEDIKVQEGDKMDLVINLEKMFVFDKNGGRIF